MNKVVTILFLSQIFFSAGLIAQYDYKIRNWTVREGLGQGSIHKMLRDSTGFLWIATDNGIDRFDGKVFRHYINSPGTVARGFKGAEALGIVEDSLHNIWVGTEEGLNRYIAGIDSFQFFVTPKSDSNMTSYCMPLVATSTEVICWEITGNIVAYNIYSLKRTIKFGSARWPSLNYYLLNNSAYDRDEATIWVPAGRAIRYFQLNTQKTGVIGLPPGAGNCSAVLLYKDKIVAATGGGIYSLSRDNGKFEIPDWAKELSGNNITTLATGNSEGIWIGTEKKGLYFFHASANKLFSYRKKETGINSISSDHIYHLYVDRDGIIWASTGNEALDQVLPIELPIIFYNQQVPGSLNNYSVRCFAEDKQQRIWIGTLGGGINIFDPIKNSFQYLTVANIPAMRDNSIHTLKFNSDKSGLLIGSETSLVYMDVASRKCTDILFVDANHGKVDAPWIHQIILFADKTWMIATTKGAFLLPEDDRIAVRIPPVKENVYFISKYGSKFTFCLWDFDPVMYNYSNEQWEKKTFPFSDVTVSCIVYDETENAFWVGTGKGLFKTDTSFQRIKHVTIDDGLPDNYIWCILSDSFGNLWLSTNKGIACYNKKSNQVRSFSPENGSHGFEYSPYAVLAASDKTVYMGGKKGFDHIYPLRLMQNLPDAAVYVSTITVNNRFFGTEQSANFTSDLNLKHSQNNFSITAGAIDFFSDKGTRLRFKLLPIEKEWQEEKAPYQIRYSGLSPGNYILRIISFDEVNAKPSSVKNINISIIAPFWQRTWFYLLFGLLLLAVSIILVQRRISIIKKREREKSESIKRMAELELQSLRAQLNPHFMFNSLNALQELILMEENEKSQSYLARFSKLLRMLLENADKPFIPLQREIDFLQLYLALEKLRIPDLQFSIDIYPNIDTEKIQIPNMILQPYIENAIWHGLAYKESDRKVHIRISSENGFTKYEIEDNGIGRKRSAELKSLYRKEHKSKGMELLSKRFKLLAKEYGSEVTTTLADVVNGNETGTIVTIKVPDNFKLN